MHKLPALRALSLVQNSSVPVTVDSLNVAPHYYGRGHLTDVYGEVKAVGYKMEKQDLREAEPDLDIFDLEPWGWRCLRLGYEP